MHSSLCEVCSVRFVLSGSFGTSLWPPKFGEAAIHTASSTNRQVSAATVFERLSTGQGRICWRKTVSNHSKAWVDTGLRLNPHCESRKDFIETFRLSKPFIKKRISLNSKRSRRSGSNSESSHSLQNSVTKR